MLRTFLSAFLDVDHLKFSVRVDVYEKRVKWKSAYNDKLNDAFGAAGFLLKVPDVTRVWFVSLSRAKVKIRDFLALNSIRKFYFFVVHISRNRQINKMPFLRKRRYFSTQYIFL